MMVIGDTFAQAGASLLAWVAVGFIALVAICGLALAREGR